MFRRHKFLMSPEGDGTGGASAGGGDSGDPLFGGGAPPAPPAAPAAPAGGTPPAPPTPPPAPPTPPPGGTTDWRAAFPEELRNQEFMKKYETPEALAKAYGNLEKMIGRDKVVVPQKGSKPEEMREYFERIGLPKDVAEYKIEGFDPKEVDPEFLKGASAEAHKLGILPDQMKGLVSWFSGLNKAAVEQQRTALAGVEKARLDAFKAELGDAYTTEIARAQAAVKTLDPKEQEHLRNTGLSKDPAVIKILAKYGATLSEDAIKGAGGRTDGVLNPSQAQEKIKEVMTSGVKHPYFDKDHVEHAKAKKDMAQLYKWAYPDKSQANS